MFATNARKATLRIAYSPALVLCSISIARAQQLSIPPTLNDSATLVRIKNTLTAAQQAKLAEIRNRQQ